MSRRFLALLPLITLLGCATAPSPETSDWYDAQTKKWVDSIVSSCQATHVNFVEKRSPVDCQVQVPTNLMMSFPSLAFYRENQTGIAEFIQGWCGSVGARYGKKPFYTYTFREQKGLVRGTCKAPGEKE